MIKLSETLHVAADQIKEVSVNSYANTVTVRMKDGIGHHVPNDHRKNCFDTAERMVGLIEAEVAR